VAKIRIDAFQEAVRTLWVASSPAINLLSSQALLRYKAPSQITVKVDT
jgi:hypothetical protein